MFSDIRRGLLAVPAELTRIAETVGRDSYDQLAARYLTGQAEGLGQEIKGLSNGTRWTGPTRSCRAPRRWVLAEAVAKVQYEGLKL